VGSNILEIQEDRLNYTSGPWGTTTYFNARWYDPSVGRFVTEDSNGGTRDAPISLNRYIYANDNPERYVDPTGHAAENFLTWLLTGTFFQDSGHEAELGNVVADWSVIALQAGIALVWKSDITKAATSLLFGAGGLLTGEGTGLVTAIASGDPLTTVKDGLQTAGDAIGVFVGGLSFWDKAGFVAPVGLNWGGDVLSEGDLAAAGDYLGYAAAGLDTTKLAFDMLSVYGSNVHQYVSTHPSDPTTTWVVTGAGAVNSNTGRVLF
jgi:RHS repeat-associated protein